MKKKISLNKRQMTGKVDLLLSQKDPVSNQLEKYDWENFSFFSSFFFLFLNFIFSLSIYLISYLLPFLIFIFRDGINCYQKRVNFTKCSPIFLLSDFFLNWKSNNSHDFLCTFNTIIWLKILKITQRFQHFFYLHFPTILLFITVTISINQSMKCLFKIYEEGTI